MNIQRHLLSTIFLFSFLTITLSEVKSQETRILTMEECIDIALSNNIALKRAKNNSLIAEANKKQAILNYLPTLQGAVNYDFFTGTFFDTNIGRQVTETTNSSGPNINSNLIIFNGLRNHHNRRQMDNLYDASIYNVEDSRQQVKANVVTYYLNVAAGSENIKIAEERINLLNRQLERENKRVEAGVGKLEEVYNLRSQLSNEKLSLISVKNQYERDKLLLIQTLQIKDVSDVDVAPLEIDENEINQPIKSYGEIIDQSVAYSPSLKSSMFNLNAADNAINLAKADRYPTLSLFGQIGSNYSSNGARNPETGDLQEDATFFDQLDFNQYEYFNLRLSIPIFNQGRTNNNIQTAKINRLNAELDLQQAELQLNNAVQQAYLDMVTAKTTYDAALENLEALNQIFTFMEARYNAGNSDFYTYLESLNNKNRAEIELINAKYSMALRRKVLNIYQGLDN